MQMFRSPLHLRVAPAVIGIVVAAVVATVVLFRQPAGAKTAGTDPPATDYSSLSGEDRAILGDHDFGSLETAKRYVAGRKGFSISAETSEEPPPEFDPQAFFVYDDTPNEQGLIADSGFRNGSLHQLIVAQSVWFDHDALKPTFEAVAADRAGRPAAMTDAGYELRCDPAWWIVDIEGVQTDGNGTALIYVRATGTCDLAEYRMPWFDGILEEVWTLEPGETEPELLSRVVRGGSGLPAGDGAE